MNLIAISIDIFMNGVAFLLALIMFLAVFGLAYFVIGGIVSLIIQDIKSNARNAKTLKPTTPVDTSDKTQPVDIDDSELMEAMRNLTGDGDLKFNKRTR